MLTLQKRRSSAKERANARWESKMREPSSLARHDSWKTRKLPPSYLHARVNGCLASLWRRRDSKYVRQMNGRCKQNHAGKWRLLPLTLLWLKIAIYASQSVAWLRSKVREQCSHMQSKMALRCDFKIHTHNRNPLYALHQYKMIFAQIRNRNLLTPACQ